MGKWNLWARINKRISEEEEAMTVLAAENVGIKVTEWRTIAQPFLKRLSCLYIVKLLMQVFFIFLLSNLLFALYESCYTEKALLLQLDSWNFDQFVNSHEWVEYQHRTAAPSRERYKDLFGIDCREVIKTTLEHHYGSEQPNQLSTFFADSFLVRFRRLPHKACFFASKALEDVLLAELTKQVIRRDSSRGVALISSRLASFSSYSYELGDYKEERSKEDDYRRMKDIFVRTCGQQGRGLDDIISAVIRAKKNVKIEYLQVFTEHYQELAEARTCDPQFGPDHVRGPYLARFAKSFF